MKTTHVFATLLITTIFTISTPLLQAGNLNPTAPPTAGTMKTLDEVEPRIAINSENTPGDLTSLYVISEPGSYYLTSNITVNFKHAIRIDSSDVTLDLMGHRLYSAYLQVTGDTDFDGICISSDVKNIRISNGSIISRREPSGMFYYNGFRCGIYCFDAETQRVSISNICIIGSRSTGIYLPGDHIKVDNVQVMNNDGSGIKLGNHCKVTNSEVASNGQSGISLGYYATVTECEVHDNGSVDTYNIVGIGANDGSIIKNNKVYDNFKSSLTATHIAAVRSLMGCEVTGNCIFHNAESVTDFSYFYGLIGGQGCTISGNTIYNNGNSASGYKIYGLYGTYGCTIKGNTVYDNFDSANVTEGEHTGSIVALDASTSCTVIGNTVTHNNSSAIGTCKGIKVLSYSFVDQNTAYENNGTNLDAPSTTCVIVNNVAP